MREILYRGKPKNKEHSYFFSEIWKKHYEKGFVYGSLIVYKDRCFIAVSAQCDIKHCVNNGLVSMIEVAPETVGQYTGLTDKNGTRIFEGDIVKSCEYDDVYFVRYFDNDNYPAFDCVPDVPLCECNGLSYLVNEESCEVIGNIHDNPELLKGGVEE